MYTMDLNLKNLVYPTKCVNAYTSPSYKKSSLKCSHSFLLFVQFNELILLKGLLHYPTCRVQLEVSVRSWTNAWVTTKWRIWKSGSREVRKSGWRNLTTGSFWLPNSYFNTPTDELGPYTIIQFEGSKFISWSVEIAVREPKTAGCKITSSRLPDFQMRHL